MIGTSVPGLDAKDGPKGRPVVLGEDLTLVARTLPEQVCYADNGHVYICCI